MAETINKQQMRGNLNMPKTVYLVLSLEELNPLLAKFFSEDICFREDLKPLCDELEKLEDLMYPAVHIAEDCGAASSVCKAIFRHRMDSHVCNAIFRTQRIARKIKKLRERIVEIRIRWLCPPCEGLPEVAAVQSNSSERWNTESTKRLPEVYEALPNVLKPCVLYFSVFPKSNEIECEHLLHMWIAQGLVSGYVYNLRRVYIDELINRGLIEVSHVGAEQVECCKIHDLWHDLALSESVKQTKCPGFRTLLLSKTSIPECIFNNLMRCFYLRVLDLSYTTIISLPISIGKLKHLRFLNLSRTNISELPENLSGLRRLQFLDVSHCSNLSKLHSGIGSHKCMLYLNLKSCEKLDWLPLEISKLNHLQTLKGTLSNVDALQLKDLKRFILLRHLSLQINDLDSRSAQEGIFMKKLQTLSLINHGDYPLYVGKDMEVMECLQTARLHKCIVPKWIFGLQNLMELELELDNSDDYKGLETTPNLKKLNLLRNNKCTEFPKEFGEREAFPKLEELVISHFNRLKKFPSLHPEAMPMLKYFSLTWCDKLKKMVKGIEKLKSLKKVEFRIKNCPADIWEGEWLQMLKARQIKINP